MLTVLNRLQWEPLTQLEDNFKILRLIFTSQTNTGGYQQVAQFKGSLAVTNYYVQNPPECHRQIKYQVSLIFWGNSEVEELVKCRLQLHPRHRVRKHESKKQEETHTKTYIKHF